MSMPSVTPSSSPTDWTDDEVLANVRRVIHTFMGLRGVTMHQCRHWFGTKTYQACRDLRVVQELMGHSDPKTTAIYTAFAHDDGAAAVLALDHVTT